MIPFKESKVKSPAKGEARQGRQKSKVIIVMGPPGAGKGTQGQLLAEKFNLYFWDTSKVIGKQIETAQKGEFVLVEEKKYYFEEERELPKRGILWHPPFVVHLANKKIQELAQEGKGIALIGSPRTLYEGKRIIPLLKRLYGAENIKVILIELNEEESIWRNSHRKTCELMGHTILYTKETAQLKICPFDGSKLIIREDDTPETIKVRLKEYKERTAPLIEYFKKQRLEVKTIDGSPPPAEVFKNILKAIK